ncbi:prepilin-type N-terminal cleavage/methylation domain-containing protein [Geobacter sp.]|uniref:type IV pilin protein n=1 Tax=Geobacter sp. TaxID=46610 RepID=UPI002620F878|nr:prepilin-type N-terminal cleavage/methylation domain-containing protein [Geobacter sp.]
MLRRLLKNSRGFTLIELMTVVTIIGILASIAVPNYKWGLIRAREAVLRENLYNIRNTIDQFFADQGKYPDTLQDLVDKGYLRELPRDPFTGKNDTWVAVPPPEPAAGATTQGPKDMGKVFDVHSGSDLVGSDGKPYNEW